MPPPAPGPPGGEAAPGAGRQGGKPAPAPPLPFTPLPAEAAQLVPELAEAIAEGLVAVGGDLAPERLLALYRRGLFPWFSAGEPILWYSPDPRFVLLAGGAHVPRSVARLARRGGFEMRLDTAFGEVIRRCASAPRKEQDGTWIGPEMIAAYEALAAAGHAHAVETWQDGELVGGLYGVVIGGAFFAESMFHEVSGASKLALAWLVEQAAELGIELIDCQVKTPTPTLFGAAEIPRSEFLARLRQLCARPARFRSTSAPA